MAKKPTAKDMLKRLLKAENNAFNGTISQVELRRVATACRAFLKSQEEPK